MSTLDTHRELKGGGSQEGETPQTVDGHTSTVSTEVSMENAYLDSKLFKSAYTVGVDAIEVRNAYRKFARYILGFNHGN